MWTSRARLALGLALIAACGGGPAGATSGGAAAAPAVAAPSRAPATGGVFKDPYAASTWIDKLDDPAWAERAVTELQRLKDPAAIGPLSDVWRKRNESTRVLRVILEIAETPAQGEPQWGEAMPVLREAIESFDESDDRSVDNAVIAAEGCGKSGDTASVDWLIKVVNAPMVGLSKGQVLRLAAIKALGSFGGDRRAVDTLIKVLDEVETLQARLTGARNDDEALAQINRESGPQLVIFGATINALAASRAQKALPALLSALYTLSPLYQQVRRGLVSIGLPAVPELIRIIRGEHTEINALAKKYNLNIDCGPDNMGPETTCQAPSNLAFKAATILGDMHAADASKDLVAALKRPPMPAFFDSDVPGPSQHVAILDALRRIGDPGTAAAISACWRDRQLDRFPGLRSRAVDAYSFVTRETSALPALAKVFTSDREEEQLRLTAALAYGRLARESTQLVPLERMVKRYQGAADKEAKKAEKARVKLDAAGQILDAAKEALANAGGRSAPANLHKAAAKAQDAYDDARSAQLDLANRARGYRDFQRTFEQHLARAEVGIRCQDEPVCYAAELDKPAAQKGTELSGYVAQDTWAPEEREQNLIDLRTGAIERALVELSKLGEQSGGVTEKILALVGSDDRLIRRAALLALVHTAKLPCAACVTALDDVIAAAKDSTMRFINAETEVVRTYFVTANERATRDAE